MLACHYIEANATRKTAGIAENPACQETLFCEIPIKVVILLLAKTSIPYRSHTTQNLSTYAFDLSRSDKVEFDCAIGLPIYDFL